jgi:hypothetical protein
VIPDFGSVASFLLLVAPGLLFQLTRERFRPSLRESAFREVGNIALGSVVFHTLALLISLLLAWRFLTVFDIERWLRQGKSYVIEQWPTLAALGAGEVLLACLLAVAGAWYLAGLAGEESLHRRPFWYRTFKEDAPDRTTTFVQVTLEGGVEYWGRVVNYTSEDVPMEERELELGGPPLYLRLPGEADLRTLPDAAERVLLPGGEIRAILVTYPSTEPRGVDVPLPSRP